MPIGSVGELGGSLIGSVGEIGGRFIGRFDNLGVFNLPAATGRID